MEINEVREICYNRISYQAIVSFITSKNKKPRAFIPNIVKMLHNQVMIQPNFSRAVITFGYEKISAKKLKGNKLILG